MKISVVGCGWLGLPLAVKLVKEGHEVLGSTTTTEKLTLLAEKGIKPFLMKLNPMPEGKDFNQLFDAEIMVINIPPRSKSREPEFHREQIKYLKYQLSSSKIKKVIFISSTSYYPNTNGLVNEETAPNVLKGSNQAVVWAEQEISQINQELTILRCGGLMGENRIPGRWFAGKDTKGANTPINYVHQEDVINKISELVNSDNWQKVVNLVSPEHLTRKEMHEAMAHKYSFEPPIWIEPSLNQHKVVESLYAEESSFKKLLSY